MIWREKFILESALIILLLLGYKPTTNISVQVYLEAVKTYQDNIAERKSTRKGRRKPILDFDRVIQHIEQTRNAFYLLYNFSKYASELKIKQVFELLLLETRNEQLIRYLWIFKNRELPRLDNYLLNFAQTDDELLQTSLIAALANNKDSSLRDLALNLIQE